ncbi:selenocysteine-specific translation elongation factor [Aceticella autotrophica]|uniref:Selenocysteine-specific elongation factor n=1 Tax=Aceticella autotrophica TaxID=2755338 RepID=A0A975AUR2_9THEO|nr:selenocysteine-specific translation elongation factor [Aceticella autotrophica]QSZ26836.1 selenocysteine-specific translation elongation factor [Aceticella autotrophica]
MKNIIIGTAGHVDHGKTALIKALTGRDTDRLQEEKQRGMTIDLGFTYFDLPSGIRAGIIDVPGHEKFIKNMLAGAYGIDIVLLVIAADEGIMPQTKEHIDILSFLGIKNGIVVITKCDMVDDEWLNMMKDDIKKGLSNTFLKDAPVAVVSSVTGEGINQLIKLIDEKAQNFKKEIGEGIYRLPIDRIFSVAGFGTVVTGTLVSGMIKIGDKVMVYPDMLESRVRNLQVHDKDVKEAYAGQRTAINLANINTDKLKRGDVIAPPGAIEPSNIIDVRLSLLKSSKTLENRDRIRFYTGASETIGRIILLDKSELKAGENAYAQILLENYVSVLNGDYFVIRTYSPMITIGGGIILVSNPLKHKRFKNDVIEELKKIEKFGMNFLIEKKISNSILPVAFSEIERMAGISNLEKIINANMSIIKLNKNGIRYLYHKETFDKICKNAKNILTQYHKNNPLREGMPKEEFKSKIFKDFKSSLNEFIVELMVEEKIIKIRGQFVSLWGYNIVLTPEQETIKNEIMKVYENAGYNVPKPTEFPDYKKVAAVFEYLINEGRLIKINEEIFLTENNFLKAKDILTNYLKENKEITLAIYRDLLKTSRKYAVSILEYFDSIKLTKKVGDIRILY